MILVQGTRPPIFRIKRERALRFPLQSCFGTKHCANFGFSVHVPLSQTEIQLLDCRLLGVTITSYMPSSHLPFRLDHVLPLEEFALEFFMTLPRRIHEF